MEPRDTVLVVNNITDVVGALRDALTSAGYRVLVAGTLDVGLKILAAFRIALVLIDAPTPHPQQADVDTFWAQLDRLASTAAETHLIVYAEDNSERRAAYAAHGYEAHLATPVEPDALVRSVAALLPGVRLTPTIVDQTALTGQG